MSDLCAQCWVCWTLLVTCSLGVYFYGYRDVIVDVRCKVRVQWKLLLFMYLCIGIDLRKKCNALFRIHFGDHSSIGTLDT